MRGPGEEKDDATGVEHTPHKERPACGECQSNRQMARLKKSTNSFFICTLEQF